jgi:hypothetical protein
VRDNKAANGRIIDGQIVEVSLVDRPANPNCQLVLAKSVEGESSLVQVEELTEEIIKHPGHDQSSHGRGGGRAGAGAGAAGGGGGGGGSAGEGGGESGGAVERNAKISRSAKDAKSTIKESKAELDDAYVKHAKNPKSSTADKVEQSQIREDAENHMFDAAAKLGEYSSGGDKARLASAAVSLNSAAKVLSESSLPAFKKTGAKLGKAGKDIERALGAKKTTNAELRKALQFALESLSLNKSEETPMKDSIVELPTEAVGDLLKFDKTQYEAAREALANLIAIEAGEMRDGHNELQSIAHLLEAVAHLHAWYEGEEAEGEVMEEETIIERAAGSDKEMKPAKDESKPDFLKRCKEAGVDDDMAKSYWDKFMGAEKGAEPNPVPTQETYATLAGTVIVPPTETPKSAEADEAVEAPTEEPAVEETPVEAPVEEAVTEDSEAKTEVDAADVEAIVEQVVKSATESLRAEIASLVAAKEAALEKSVVLESELAIAKSLAVAGGPSRTAKPLSTKINDNLTKAAIYKAKANATTDPVLAKGYKQLAEEFYSKASDSDNN